MFVNVALGSNSAANRSALCVEPGMMAVQDGHFEFDWVEIFQGAYFHEVAHIDLIVMV